MKKIEFIVQKEASGYGARAAKDAIFTVGDDFDELKANMLEAANLHFEEEIQEGQKPYEGKDLIITLDLPQFFEFYKVINAKALSKRIGMNPSLLAQYISGIKKPSQRQTERILKGIKQLGAELAAIDLVA